MTLESLFDMAKGSALAKFNRMGEHVPTFILHGIDGLLIVPAPWRDHNEKHAAVIAVKHIAKAAGATRVIVITEGWMVTRPPGANTEGLVPSKERDRVEVIWIAGQSSVPGEQALARTYAISRDAAGKATVGTWTSNENGTSMTIFDGIVGGGILQ